MTITLLLNSEGKKMGKTEKGAVWLDAEKTSPYDFFQYWRNVGDADVIKCLKMLTFLPIEEIEEMEKHLDSGAAYNNAKEILAYELTALVHGEEEAEKQRAAARAIFAGSGDSENMPATELTADDLIKVVTGKIKQNRGNKEKVLALLKSYGAAKISDVPADKYEAFLTDLSQI
jgi:tyrosyl-tRNA synthetase